MGFQPFHVHYEQRTSNTSGKDVTFNVTYTQIKVTSNSLLDDLRSKLANVSIPAARRVYSNDPYHQSGFHDDEHEGKWKFHFEDQFGKQEKNGNAVVDRYLDEQGFENLATEMGGINPTWRYARIWHVSIFKIKSLIDMIY